MSGRSRTRLASARAHTDFCRAPGIFHTGPLQLQLPLELRTINGVVRIAGELRPLDFDVFAWLCERWAASRSADGVVELTKYQITRDLYGAQKSGGARESVSASMLRLWRVEVAFTDWNSVAALPGSTLDRVIYRIGNNAALDGERDPRKIAQLRGNTFWVQLAPWLIQAIGAGHVTYLDWRIMRDLGSGLAKRLWILLQSERMVPDATGLRKLNQPLALAPPAMAALGLANTLRRDARRQLRTASKRILETDDRFEDIWMSGTPARPGQPGRWFIHATMRHGDRLLEHRRVHKAALQQILDRYGPDVPVLQTPSARRILALQLPD